MQNLIICSSWHFLLATYVGKYWYGVPSRLFSRKNDQGTCSHQPCLHYKWYFSQIRLQHPSRKLANPPCGRSSEWHPTYHCNPTLDVAFETSQSWLGSPKELLMRRSPYLFWTSLSFAHPKKPRLKGNCLDRGHFFCSKWATKLHILNVKFAIPLRDRSWQGIPTNTPIWSNMRLNAN